MPSDRHGDGPLDGVKVIELAGKGAAPYCAMFLSDMGADVIRIDRLDHVKAASMAGPPRDFRRGRRSVGVDLKHPDGTALVKRLLLEADVLLEGYRPGVAERLGLGPVDCMAVRPQLVYGRVTGWGQTGPYANRVGHDINYVAISSLLASVGVHGGKPLPPLNIAGDGAGGMMGAFGVVCALFRARTSGVGCVVDAAMLDAAASLMGTFYLRRPYGLWNDERGTNKVDGGAPFYDTYATADGGYIAVGAIEPLFYRDLLAVCGLESVDLPDQWDLEGWPQLRASFTRTFQSKTQSEWLCAAEGKSACLSPVLGMDEAPEDPHNRERGTFIELDGVTQPAPAPRFGPTALPPRFGSAKDGEHTRSALVDWGLDADEVNKLLEVGAVAETP